MSSSLIGVIHPYRKEETTRKFSIFLTVYEWIQGNLTRKASIKLLDGFQGKESNYIIAQLYYDEP